MSQHIFRGCRQWKKIKCGLNNEDSLMFKEFIGGDCVNKHFLSTCLTCKLKFVPKLHLLNHPRTFYTSSVSYKTGEPNKPSSKVEETTDAIKEKTKEVSVINLDTQPLATSGKEKSIVVKKSIRQRIVDEIIHYYHGFKLLFIDIKVSSSLVRKVLRGGSLTRREYNLLIRTVGDMFRLIPFSIFIIVPFMELLLPVFIKLFPGMLPSTFQTATEKDEKIKQALKVKLEMAKFLQQTLDEMAVKGKGHDSQSAKDFVESFHKIRAGGRTLTSEEILKFSKLFEDEITLDSLTRSQLVALCGVLELKPFGTTTLLQFQLRLKLRSLAADDRSIKKEGVESLTESELQEACRARGILVSGLSETQMRTKLTQWLDLSLNEKISPLLLLLSRAFMLPETTTTTEKLVATISALPATVETKTKAVIGEREGKVHNKTKIELIKDEVAKIQEENNEMIEVSLDKSSKLIEKPCCILGKSKEEKDLSAKDIGETLENVLDAVSKDKKKMIIEKEELDDLKEEMEDYDKDVQHLKEVAELAKESKIEDSEVKESKAAKRLSRAVNKMITKMDTTLTELDKKETDKKMASEKDDSQTTSSELLRINELLEAISKLRTLPGDLKREELTEVLEKIDFDKDGLIKADDLLKVLEVIGRENIQLTQKQIDDVIELLKKEEEINNDKP